MKNKKAFTLAEVLITLMIIGIVASMVIPVISVQKDKQAWASQFKKTYSVISDAYRLTIQDYGGDVSSLFDNTDTTHGNVAMQAIAKHLNLSKNCGAQTGCWYDDIKELRGTPAGFGFEASVGWAGRVILSDGTLVGIESSYTGCTSDETVGVTAYIPPSYKKYCGEMYVDVNGKKPPNTFGRDLLGFDITAEGVYPWGVGYSDDDINASCSSSGNGWYCPIKIIREGAMNY